MKYLLAEVSYDDLSPSQKKIADCIGLDEYKELIKRFGGNRIHILKKSTFVSSIRRRTVLEDYYKRNLDPSSITRNHGLSEYSVRDIINHSQIRRSKIDEDKSYVAERNKQIVHDYIDLHLSSRAISEKYHLSDSHVRGILRCSESVQQQKNEIIIRNENIMQDYETGLYSFSKLGLKYNLHPDCVRGIVNRTKKARISNKTASKKSLHEAVLRDYNDFSLSWEEIMQKYKLSRSCLNRILREKNQISRKKKELESVKKRNDAIAHDYFTLNVSKQELCDKYKLTRPYINEILRRYK